MIIRSEAPKFQGDVRLRIEATDQVRTVMLFVSALRQIDEIRVLDLIPTKGDGVYIRMALSKPLSLISTLRQIEAVSTVEDPENGAENGDEPLIHVRLTENASIGAPQSTSSLESSDLR